MSISICIPCHNFLAEPLLKSLRREATEVPVFLVDDGSDEKYAEINGKAALAYHVDYEYLPKKKGRSDVRNYLAGKAQTDFLLFIDVDSLPVKRDFLASYLAQSVKADVVCGGTKYQAKMPDRHLMLRWKYGKASEETLASDRQKKPYERLSFNNLLVRRSLFLDNPLLNLKHGYGHEDTLWGRSIETSSGILHIDNPVYHIGLENNKAFLDKTRQAVENLAWLVQKKGFEDQSALSKLYGRLKSIGLHRFIPILGAFRVLIEDQLLDSLEPNLFNLNLLKLYWFHKAMNQIK